jgi:hypothetical protein
LETGRRNGGSNPNDQELRTLEAVISLGSTAAAVFGPRRFQADPTLAERGSPEQDRSMGLSIGAVSRGSFDALNAANHAHWRS